MTRIDEVEGEEKDRRLKNPFVGSGDKDENRNDVGVGDNTGNCRDAFRNGKVSVPPVAAAATAGRDGAGVIPASVSARTSARGSAPTSFTSRVGVNGYR